MARQTHGERPQRGHGWTGSGSVEYTIRGDMAGPLGVAGRLCYNDDITAETGGANCTMKTEDTLEGLDLAHAIVGKLEEHQASDIVLMDLRDITPLADYFVICSADSERQARTLQEILLEDLKKEIQVRQLSAEGEAASGWILIDYNWVIVHIFSRDARAFYRLEELWKAAPVVLKIQ